MLCFIWQTTDYLRNLFWKKSAVCFYCFYAIIATFSDMNKIIFLLKLQKNIFGFQVQQSPQ